MTDLAKYLVALELQNAEYIKRLDQANNKLDRFHKDQERAVAKIKSAFLTIGKTLATAFTVRAITQFTAASVRLADEIGKVSRAAGVSAESLQELRYALGDLGGVASGQVDQGLQRFNRQIGLAALGNKRAADTLNVLGVALKTTSGQARGTEAVLNDALAALAGIEDDAKRAALAGRLFGEEMGPKLAAALDGGIEKLDQTRAAVVGLISEQNVKDAELLNDAFERIAKTIGGTLRNASIEAAADLGALLGIIDRGPAGDLSAQIEDIERRIVSFRQAAAAGALGGNQVLLDEAESQLKLLQAQLKIAENAMPFRNRRQLFEARAAGQDMAQIFAEGFGERIGTIYDRLPDLKLQEPDIDMDFLDEFEEIVVKAKPLSMDDLIQTIDPAQVRRLFEPINNQAEETARYIGSTFQDAFSDWILGTERSFGELLKRMAAQLATSALFKTLGSLFPGGSFFSNFFGGARAEGGPVSAGKGYIVGERGPEWFMPGISGAIIPNGGGGLTYNDHTMIDARGADQSLVARLPGVLAENRKQTQAELRELMRRRRF